MLNTTIKVKLLNGGPSKVIAEATDANGNTICRCTVETVLLVSGYVVSPRVSPSQAQTAGDVLDKEIATKASIEGISKVLISVPQDQLSFQDAECTKLSVYTRSVNIVTQGCFVPSQPTQYLN